MNCRRVVDETMTRATIPTTSSTMTKRGKRQQQKLQNVNDDYNTLWSGTNNSTGPLARPFARSLTHSLAPDCSLCSRPPLRSLACLLRSLPCSWESELFMSENDLALSHSTIVLRTVMSVP